MLQIPQPTGVSGGGLGARTSNTAIVWISVSVTVGLSVFTAVAVIVFAAAVYSHRKGQVPQKKRKTGIYKVEFGHFQIPSGHNCIDCRGFSLLNYSKMLNGCDSVK